MSSYANNANNSTDASNASNKKIDSELGARLGDFGIKMMENIVCSFGAHVWFDHGLTEQDKKDFEDYQENCDIASHTSLLDVANDPTYYCLTLLSKIKKYEDNTPPEKRAIIEEIVAEVIGLYEIDNVQPRCLQKSNRCDGCDECMCVDEALMPQSKEADMWYIDTCAGEDEYDDDEEGYDSEYYKEQRIADIMELARDEIESDGYGSD
jgi:hypothetical protein